MNSVGQGGKSTLIRLINHCNFGLDNLNRNKSNYAEKSLILFWNFRTVDAIIEGYYEHELTVVGLKITAGLVLA